MVCTIRPKVSNVKDLTAKQKIFNPTTEKFIPNIRTKEWNAVGGTAVFFIWRYMNLAHYRFQDLDSKRFLARANPEIGLLKHIFKSLNGFGFLGLCTVLIYSHAHFYPLVFICIPKLYPFPNPKPFLSHSYQHILIQRIFERIFRLRS